MNNHPLSHKRPTNLDRFYYGTAYYPEQWDEETRAADPERMAYTSIARGADSLLFFRWRPARFGAEEFWCGVLDHDNVPRRRYQEAAQLGEELKRVGPALLGTSVFANIGAAAADQEVYDAHAAMSLGPPGAYLLPAAGLRRRLHPPIRRPL